MSIDEMITVLEAARDGKPIQIKRKDEPLASWINAAATSVEWNFHDWDYRVKPEPRVLWVRYYGTYRSGSFDDRLEAMSDKDFTVVKFVEVLE